MTGKKESLLEKILKPVRINPITFGLALLGVSQTFLFGGDSDISTISSKTSWSMLGIGAGFFWAYIFYLFRFIIR